MSLFQNWGRKLKIDADLVPSGVDRKLNVNANSLAT
jgi:hypothetical protein